MTTRRAFMSYLPIVALAGAIPARAAEAPPSPPPEYFRKHTAPEGASFFLSQVPKSERGERMVIRGVVMDADGKPIPNASIYIYHTDAEGRYDPSEPRPGLGSDKPRLHGYLRTDSVGRYVYGSVRPAPYPGAKLPARVRYVVTAEGYRDRSFEFWFEGDPMITAEHLATQARHPQSIYIRPAVRDSNRVWQVTFDIVMDRK